MKYWWLYLLFFILIVLAGCTTHKVPVIKEVPVEVKIPVSAPCMGARPAEVKSLKSIVSREEWDALTSDQREKLLGAQSLKHKSYGDKLTVASAGCQ